MDNLFPIIEVPDDAVEAEEAMGSKFKFWFEHPTLGQSLFKLARPNTGEDWSEKIAAEIAKLLGLPHAHYELATWRKQPGSIGLQMLPANTSLQHGNDILSSLVSSYPLQQSYKLSEHTLDILLTAVNSPNIEIPPNWTPPLGIQTAAETFVGYLLLDAWIGNVDRHHENWGFIIADSKIHLAPTYDHAACLGRELLEEKLITKLNNKSVMAYAEKARSALYAQVESKRPMPTLEAFIAITQHYPHAGKVWLEKLSCITTDDIRGLLGRVPASRISPSAQEFAYQILEFNKTRLLSLKT